MGFFSPVQSDRSHAANVLPNNRPASAHQAATPPAAQRGASVDDVFEGQARADDGAGANNDKGAAQKTPIAAQGYFARLGKHITGWLHTGSDRLHRALCWGTTSLQQLREGSAVVMSKLGAAIKDVGQAMVEMARNLRGTQKLD